MGYQKEIYESAFKKLEARRQSSKQTLESHRLEVKERLPEVEEIQLKMLQTSVGIAKAVVMEPDNAGSFIERLGSENLSLQRQREQLLLSAGYPKDYLSEKHFCDQCKDSGYLGINMCDCLKTLLKQEAFSRLSFACENYSCRFDEFRLDFYPKVPDSDGAVPFQRMTEIRDLTKEYARNFSPEYSQSLLFIGKTGLGKTHLSLSIAFEVTNKGYGVVYTPVQRLMDKLESQKFSYSQDDKEEYAHNMNLALECDLLILDDLGTEFVTSFTNSIIYNIVNTRLVEGRPTIINTNLEIAEIEKVYSQRMASRLGFSYIILKFYGNDIRFVLRQQKFNKQNG